MSEVSVPGNEASPVRRCPQTPTGGGRPLRPSSSRLGPREGERGRGGEGETWPGLVCSRVWCSPTHGFCAAPFRREGVPGKRFFRVESRGSVVFMASLLGFSSCAFVKKTPFIVCDTHRPWGIPRLLGVQGYLAREKLPLPQDCRRALRIGLHVLWGP